MAFMMINKLKDFLFAVFQNDVMFSEWVIKLPKKIPIWPSLTFYIFKQYVTLLRWGGGYGTVSPNVK